MNPSLDAIRQTIRAAGAVRAEAVQQLRDALLADAPPGRDDAELLLAIDAEVGGAGNDAGWPALFAEVLTAHLLGDPGLPGVVSDETASHVIARLGADPQVSEAGLALLVSLCAQAQRVPECLLDYALAALEQAVRDEGRITQHRAEQVHRVVCGRGSSGKAGVNRKLAGFLFDLNDITSGRPNHASWTGLFVDAIGEHLLADEESPGEVDPAEMRWLVARIEADQQYDATERALLARIKHTIRHEEVWGGIRSDDLQAVTSGMVASLYSRACYGGKGGDLYYFSVSAGDLLTRIAVADVSGHGPAVADMSQWIYQSLAARINIAEGSEVLADLSRMAAERGYRALTTAVVVSYYRPDARLWFAYAGHPPMFVLRAGDRHWRRVVLDQGPQAINLPLGVDPDMRYEQGCCTLTAGDRLFLYTDGLVEAPGPDGGLFGSERLLEALAAGSGKSPRGLKDAVLAALVDHTGGRLAHDDVTFMAVEVR